ncbi:transposable element Tcb1 transposase [Trichonephila clavipes]|nr:transposable element Tcb1 transposase [Trichonephila clavipes]
MEEAGVKGCDTLSRTQASERHRRFRECRESVKDDKHSGCPQTYRTAQSGLSVRRALFGIPLTQKRRHIRRQWCDERRMWVAAWNEVVFNDETRICLQHHDRQIRVWRHRGEMMLNSCVMHHHTGLTLGIMLWGGIGYHSHTLLVRLADTLNSQHYISEVLEPVVLHYLQGSATAIFQQDNARPHGVRIVQMSFVNRQIELLPGSFADIKHVVHGCSTIDPNYTPSCPTRSTSATWRSCLVCCTPRTLPKSLNQCRGVWQR